MSRIFDNEDMRIMHEAAQFLYSEEDMQICDEQIRIDKFKIDNFLRLGYSIYEAVEAVDSGIDWHDVEELVNAGARLPVALQIAR